MVTIKYKILIFTSDLYLVHGFIFFLHSLCEITEYSSQTLQ